MTQDMLSQAPPLKTRVLFWVLIGVFSVILAEVVSFSSPFAFVDAWGLLAVFPLYALHSLVLAFIVFKSRRVTLSILFLAGMIFGLYEAYITKVLWSPTWGNPEPMLGGVAVVQTAVLVLFWHPWMAFIFPLMAAERILTGSSEVFSALPARVRGIIHSKRGRIVFICSAAIFCAIYQGVNASSPGLAMLSDLQAGLVFWVGLGLWRRTTRGQTYSLRQLLPSGKSIFVLAGLLIFTYLWQGILIRPEAIPRSPGPHLVIWSLYLLAGGLLWIHIHKSAQLTPIEISLEKPLSMRTLLLYWGVWWVSAALLTTVKPIALVGVVITWCAGILIGIILLLRAIWQFRKMPASQAG
jgi:hypothetical protein